MKKITPKEAVKIAKKLGIEIYDERRTFYATNNKESEVWSFDTKKERDDFVIKNAEYNGKAPVDMDEIFKINGWS